MEELSQPSVNVPQCKYQHVFPTAIALTHNVDHIGTAYLA